MPLFFVYDLYIAIGQEEEVARTASIYVYYMIPGMIALNYNIIIVRYFSTQRQLKYGMISNIVGSVVHLAVATVLINKYDMNIHGAGIASSI